jgi:hypothetical protein
MFLRSSGIARNCVFLPLNAGFTGNKNPDEIFGFFATQTVSLIERSSKKIPDKVEPGISCFKFFSHLISQRIYPAICRESPGAPYPKAWASGTSVANFGQSLSSRSLSSSSG